MDPIVFVAYLPDIKSAMLIGRDGAQVKLELPETEIASAARLILVRGKALKVTIELYDEPTGDELADNLSPATRRRSARRRDG